MRIKRFKAQDAKTAMQMVKAEMGADAVILGTREIKEDGQSCAVEITAGLNYQPPPKPLPAPDFPDESETGDINPLPAIRPTGASRPPGSGKPNPVRITGRPSTAWKTAWPK